MIDVCQGAQAVCSKTVSLPNSCLIRTFDFVEPDRENWKYKQRGIFLPISSCPQY